MSQRARRPLPDLRNVPAVRARRPLIIAHRGGVITPDSPENSLAAIRLAAKRGYDMVELDVVKPKDDEPVLFRGGLGSLLMYCGVDAHLSDRTAQELTRFRYRASEESIATLAQGLAVCQQLGLGVMLDIKEGVGSPITQSFVRRIGELLEEYALTSVTVTISSHPIVHDVLAEQIVFPVGEDVMHRVLRGEALPSLAGLFWFGLPEQLPDEAVPVLQQAGALVLPAINTFRYPPHAHETLAREDIVRLRAVNVDGFQIDSVYGPFLGLSGD
jgi:glycerophosphoryl diester phosphodiesterase